MGSPHPAANSSGSGSGNSPTYQFYYTAEVAASEGPSPPVYPPPPVSTPAPVQAEALAYPPRPPPVSTGTPVSFPPTNNQYAATPPHQHQYNNVMAGGASPYLQQPIGDPWSTGLFDCNLNENNAIMTAFFPCVTFGQIAEIVDEGQTTCTVGGLMYVMMVPALLSSWILGSNYRKRLRLKYNLVEAPYEDWATHLLCPCCALCQEYRELEKRGFNPSQGWMGHLAMQHRTQMAPPQNQFMTN